MTLSLSQGVLQRRVFNEAILQSHIKNFMLGQTPKFIHPRRTVVDVGAAVGMYSHFWADKCKHIHSFEAVPPVYGQLCKVADKHKNMTAYNKAVSNFNGTSEFWVDDKRLSNSSFNNLVDGQKITVDVIQLDDMELGCVGFMKIDVEGFELNVLQGAIDLIESCHPTIMCEIYPKFNNGPVLSTFEFMFDFGYKCFYNEKGKGLNPVLSANEGVVVASADDLIALHDGDFLFVYGD